MRADDLTLDTLFDADPKGGVYRFAGERAVLLDTAALGLLRKELIDTLSLGAARGVLYRFGWAHGFRTAEAMKRAFDWESPEEWIKAGGRLHRLKGLVTFRPVPRESGTPPRHFSQAIWEDSYEAEQHVLHFGLADEPVCWTLTGFASGYLTAAHGRSIRVVEETCVGKGDAICRMAGEPEEEWDEATRRSLAGLSERCLEGELARVRDALRTTEAKLKARRSELTRLKVEEEHPGVIARSPGMRRAFDLACRVARVDSTVLLTGESGSGKEVLARVIHERSGRSGGPFVAINGAALPENLLESELFGHARGAFSGAASDRPGLFEAANGGTLLLDEIGEVPLGLQAKLLRALQEREVRRLGENRSRKIDVRVVAATNRDLAKDVETGHFRKDLYYRLRVIEIPIPPLRERPEDVLPLAKALLLDAAARIRVKVSGFTPEAARLLLRHPWPGNVRELANAVERAVVLADGVRVDAEDLPDEIVRPVRGSGAAGDTLADVEKAHVLAVLAEADGHREKAAKRLGIGVATLYRKLKEWGEEGR
ncbi:MAG TPA: sigma 54-interacting transcriptional regulator [Thermoanaerobaculia bacterium]|nr:sigma 54-interacting transcriptional regulator [Thermoanaerobaculia bacterium]